MNRNQKSEIRNQKSEIRNLATGLFFLLCTGNAFAQTATAENSEQNCDDLAKTHFSLWQKQCLTRLDDIVVVATQAPFSNALYAGQVTTFNGEKLKESANLATTLRKIPGVVASSDSQRQINSKIYIRGYTNQAGVERVLIEQDGIPRDTSTPANQISSNRVDTDLLSSVEVVKGSSSILHGAGVIGGAVSMRTKDARDYLKEGQKVGAMVGGRYDSNNARSYRTAVYAKPNAFDVLFYFKRGYYNDVDLPEGGVNYTSGGEAIYQKVYENDEQINTYFTKFGYDIADDQRISLSVFHYRDKLLTAWNTAMPDYRDNPTAGKLKQQDIVLDYQYVPNDWINLTAKAYRSNFTYDRRVISANVGDHYLNKDRRDGFTLKNQSNFDTGMLHHQLVVGADYRLRKQLGEHINNGSNITLGMLPAKAKDVGVYVQDNISFHRFVFTLGGRYDYGSRQLNGLPSPNSSKHFSPKVSFAYEAFDGVNLLAGYSETFRLPSVIELGLTKAANPFYYYVQNKNLKPETAKEFEFGFSVNKDGVLTATDHLNLKATHFTGHIEDMIALRARRDIMGSDGLANPSNADMGIYTWRPRAGRRFVQYQNYSKVKRTGYEAVLNYELNNWSFGSTYEHLSIKGSDGSRPVSTADKFGVTLGYLIRPIDLKLEAEVQRWLKPRIDLTEDEYNRPYTNVDLKGVWTPKNTGAAFFDNSVQVVFGVNNLFDKRYMSAVSNPDIRFVGAGRNFYLDLEKRF